METTSEELRIYLGLETIDEPRATMLIAHATSLCRAVVDPLPADAEAVVLSASARAYANPTFATSEMEGGYQVVRPSGGVYLTKAERDALRRMSGSSTGVFSASLIPADYPASRYPDEDA